MIIIMTYTKNLCIDNFNLLSINNFTLQEIILMIILYSFIVIALLLAFYRTSFIDKILNNISDKIIKFFKQNIK